MSGDAALFVGEVVHVRLRPKPHRLSYRHLAIAVDVDCLADIASRVAAFGYNRRALARINDRDYGGGSHAIADDVRSRLHAAGLGSASHRITMVTTPRLLGFGFNPITVYYCDDASGALAAMIYEVNNTFGERKSYVLPAGCDTDGVWRQTCAKEMSVSPFTGGTGQYAFHVTRPDLSPTEQTSRARIAGPNRLTIGIQYRDCAGPLIRTHMNLCQFSLTSRALVAQVLARPWSAFGVTAAIHLEAAKLYAKGTPLIRRHRSPRVSMAADSNGGQPAPTERLPLAGE